MYHLMTHPDHQLPTLISEKSPFWTDYIMSGYESINHGSRREMEAILAETMDQLYGNLLIVDFN